eukprot:GHVT01077316.1.p1 GENE.GHVT01077316.1~~GHVT01077316.1.p1  ORF type:complete len:443 (-),score=56.88 GHVT01077316.1:837-2165(-)
MAPSISEPKDHLTLKVMKLSRSQIESSLWPELEISMVQDLKAAQTLEESHDTLPEITGDRPCSLVLPATQGRSMAGEVFPVYVNVSNPSNVQVVLGIILKLEIVTSAGPTGDTQEVRRLLLYDGSLQPVQQLGPGDSMDCTVHHRLPYPGVYTLMGHVSYSLSAVGERHEFKKVYKFLVAAPFTVKSRLEALPAHQLAVVAAVCSETSAPVLLQGSHLLLSDGRVFPTHSVGSSSFESCSSEPEASALGFMHRGDSLALQFNLPADGEDSESETAASMARLHTEGLVGDVILRWYTSTTGSCETAVRVAGPPPFLSAVPKTAVLQVSLMHCPATAQARQPFEVTFSVSNTSRQSLTVELVDAAELGFSPTAPEETGRWGGVNILGTSTARRLGSLKPSEIRTVAVRLICLSPGRHSLGSLVVRDSGGVHTAQVAEGEEILVI